MKLNGEHVLQAPRRVIWDILMDPNLLVKITPGISELRKLDESKFEAISEVKIGPVKGRFTGDLSLEELVEPEHFVLHVKQNSKIGNVNAEVKIYLDEEGNGHTRLSFDGKAQMSGLLARTGARVVSGVANSLTKQFFTAFEKELELNNS